MRRHCPRRPITMPAHPPHQLTYAQRERLGSLGRVPREVFALLAASPVPLKAYDLLWQLQTQRGRQSPPSSISRALNALIEVGLAHKIESLGAFVVCAYDLDHEAGFFMCEACGGVQEIDVSALRASALALVRETGFLARRLNFEIRGRCRVCQTQI